MRKFWLLLIGFVLLGAASLSNYFLFSESKNSAQMTPIELASSVPPLPVEEFNDPSDFYQTHVQKLFNQRCVACHSCFSAPCQLNLSSYEGLERGANKLNVYMPERSKSVAPTRIEIDAHSTQEWRNKGFFEVINANQPENSNLHQLISLRQSQPQLMPKDKVEDSMVCAQTPNELSSFIQTAPEKGMPYGLPPLTSTELDVLHQWYQHGLAGPTAQTLEKLQSTSPELVISVREWESLLNQNDMKSKLISRYIYEHLFLAHLYFPQKPQEFFRLVRARSQCQNGNGKVDDEIATAHPSDDPGVNQFYYCFKKVQIAIIDKTHMPYELGPNKMARIKDLFWTPNWTPTALPSYEPKISSNPFKAFHEIPARARYQFLLDDAQYHVMTFIKGPVCSGNNAVNSIDEQFYVFFLSPNADNTVQIPDFEEQIQDDLILPNKWGSDISLLELTSAADSLISNRNEYRKKRFKALKTLRPQGYSLKDIWDGDAENPNAVLTVFRNNDNALVMKGARGDLSRTAFVLDYPLFERLVYNLVVGFDVFGNVGHQVSTRIYMSLIRMEAEELFLSFLSPQLREALRNSWYQGFTSHVAMNQISPLIGEKFPTQVAYKDPLRSQQEFVDQILFIRLNSSVRGPYDKVNWRQVTPPSYLNKYTQKNDVETELSQIANAHGAFTVYTPDVAFIRIEDSGHNTFSTYTMIHNKQHSSNLPWIKFEKNTRAPDSDTVLFLPGLWSSYPNYFYTVKREEMANFRDEMLNIKSTVDQAHFLAKYGVSRQNPHFWDYYDWFNRQALRQSPIEGGIFDLSRYDNWERDYWFDPTAKKIKINWIKREK